MIARGCNVVTKELGTFYYSKMAELKKRAHSLESDCISDLSPKKSAVPEVEEQVTPCRGILRSLGWRSGRPSSGSTILTGRSFIVAAQLFFSFAFNNLDFLVLIQLAALSSVLFAIIIIIARHMVNEYN